MKTVVVTDSPAAIGPGTALVLTDTQLATRRHAVEITGKPTRAGTPVVALALLQFKVGETLQIDGDVVPKNLQQLDVAALAAANKKKPGKAEKAERDENGDTPEMAAMRKQFDASYGKLVAQLEAAGADLVSQKAASFAEGKAAGRAEMLAEVQARNALFDAEGEATEAVEKATAALAAETDADKRKPLQQALDDALAAEAAAIKAVEALAELKA